MKNFRRVVICLGLSMCAVLGGGITECPQGGRVEAGYVLWYADVSYTYRGQTRRGYLGGYTSESAARYYYQQWAKGIGAQYRPRLNRIYRE